MLPALAVVLGLLAGCTETPAIRAWDEEVIGAVAQVNDVIALELLLGLLGVPEGGDRPVVGVQEPTPDVDRVRGACTRLADLTSAFDPLAASAPLERTGTAPKVAELAGSCTGIATVCIETVDRDPTALLQNNDLSARFSSVGALIETIGSEVASDAECPERLRASVRSCSEA